MMRKGFIIYFLLLFSSICVNAQTWHCVNNNEFYGEVASLKTIDGKLYVGGAYLLTERLVIWDESNWDSIGFGDHSGPHDIAKFQNDIIVGGSFPEVGEWNQFPYTKSIAGWDGQTWFSLMSEYFGGQINAVEEYNGELFITGEGNFLQIDGVNAIKIAKWNGSQWSAVGNSSGLGLGSTKGYALAVYNNKLIVGGDFSEAGGVEARCIASWDGSEWDSLGAGLGVIVNDMVVDTINNYLYVGGAFIVPGAVNSKNIARWDGTKWDSLGIGAPIDVACLEMYNGKLYAGIYERTGTSIDTILMAWDGQDWEYLKGFNSNIYDMEVYNGNLYVGGIFTQVTDSVQARYIACYGENCPDGVGIQEIEASKEKFRIYPNPNSGEFTIRVNEVLNEDVEIVIADVVGKIVFNETMKKQELEKKISMQGKASGIYSCAVYKQKQLLQTERIVLE